MADLVPMESIIGKILLLRGMKVMLDRDLAERYKVENRALKQAVRKNIKRFPEDFMFELTLDEDRALRSQTQVCARRKYYLESARFVLFLSSAHMFESLEVSPHSPCR